MSDAPTVSPPPLQGFRVLDLSRVLAGPWCTMILGDLGAEIIKIENPAGGDDTRFWGPPFVAGESAYFLCANRNKKSVAVDLATPEGQAVIRGLAASSDILVENFKAGGLDQYGLGHAALQAINPRLITCSISGYGQDSPLAGRPGYDYVVQAEAGLMAVTGEAEGPPMKVGVAVADLFTGMNAVQAILGAVIARDRDGLGQHIDLALYDCQLAMLANVASAYLVSGQEPARHGAAHPTIVPYQTVATRDGSVVLAVGNDRQFAAFCREVLGRPGLAADPRFAVNAKRVANRDALMAIIEDVMGREISSVWLERLQSAGVPCGAVRSVGQALTAPETAARGMIKTVTHPTIGKLNLVASPLRLSRTPVVEPSPPPLLGADTNAVLDALQDRSQAGVVEVDLVHPTMPPNSL